MLLIWPTGVYKKATLEKETKPSKQHEETVQRLLEENVMNHSQILSDLNFLFVDISFQQEFLWFFGTWFPYMPWDFSFGSWRIWHFWLGSSYLLRTFPPNQSIFNSQHLQHNIGLHKWRRQRLYFRPWCGMGGKTSKDALKGARRRASLRAGALQVSGRYHHFPRKLEDDYILSETVLGCGGALEGQYT